MDIYLHTLIFILLIVLILFRPKIGPELLIDICMTGVLFFVFRLEMIEIEKKSLENKESFQNDQIETTDLQPKENLDEYENLYEENNLDAKIGRRNNIYSNRAKEALVRSSMEKLGTKKKYYINEFKEAENRHWWG
jgi:hypothetical protein